MRLHEAAPKLIIQERVGDKVKVSSYWPVPELTRAELALGRLHARPLLDLTKKHLVWHWGEPQLKAFETLKTLMCRRPVLVQPDFERRFYLQTDASAYGIGAVLSQERGEGDTPPDKKGKPKLQPIAYY